jgi:cobalt-precorrin 5A hydrolase
MSGVIIAGIGCRRDCPTDAVIAVLCRAFAQAGCRASVLAAPEFKAGESGLRAAAEALGLNFVTIGRSALEAVQGRCMTQSPPSLRTIGIASIAEGCALAAAGPNGRLVLSRIAGEGTTCALAESGAQ